MKLSPTEIFKGKKIFFIGGTGFVGKVTLSMLHNWNADALVRNECEARRSEHGALYVEKIKVHAAEKTRRLRTRSTFLRNRTEERPRSGHPTRNSTRKLAKHRDKEISREL